MEASEVQWIVALLCSGRCVDPLCDSSLDLGLELGDDLRAKLVRALLLVLIYRFSFQMLSEPRFEVFYEVFNASERIVVCSSMQQIISFVILQVRQVINRVLQVNPLQN